MKTRDIINAWALIRKIDNTIPDEVLDFMKDAAMAKLMIEKKEFDEKNMRITVTNIITNLKPFTVHDGEEIKLTLARKDRASIWFTGKRNQIRNIFFGDLHIISMGIMDEATENAVIKMMIAGKTDILTDGVDYYTRASKGFCKIMNFNEFNQANPYPNLFQNI